MEASRTAPWLVDGAQRSNGRYGMSQFLLEEMGMSRRYCVHCPSRIVRTGGWDFQKACAVDAIPSISVYAKRW